jgi:hypothetical protein
MTPGGKSPLVSEHARMVRNLVNMYRQTSTEYDRTLGAQWYPLAHRIVCEWADTYGFSIATTACVIAAVSPQVPWERNLIIADDILAGRAPSIGALKSNVRKAEHVRDNRLSNLLATFPGGPKVNHFAVNLAGNYSRVTVDAHALQAALQDVLCIRTLKWSAYAVVADAYETAARKLQLDPATLQAIIWVTWKRLHPTAAKRAVRRQWDVIGDF